jgi:DNA polymerase-3 subunit beta
MNIIIERDAFLAALQRVMGAVDRRSTVAVLQHVAIRSTPEALHLTATNMDLQATTSCPAQGDGTHGFTLPGSMTADILSNFPSGSQVALMDDPNDPRITLKCARSRFKLPTLKPADMPVMAPPEGGVVRAPASIMADAFAGGDYAASKDMARFIYTGVGVQVIEGRLEVGTTDSKHVALSWRAVVGETGAAILPMALATEMRRLLDGSGDIEAAIVIGKTLASLRVGVTEIIGKVIDGEFVDYRFPIRNVERPYVLTVDRDDLEAAIKRAMIVTSDASRSIRMTFGEDYFSVAARGADTSDTDNEIEADWTGGAMNFSVNGGYMIDAISHLTGDTVRLEITDATKPFVIEEANRMVIMGVQRG